MCISNGLQKSKMQNISQRKQEPIQSQIKVNQYTILHFKGISFIHILQISLQKNNKITAFFEYSYDSKNKIMHFLSYEK